jgi:hypothetical protein
MCYGIKDLIGKKVREETVVQRPGVPERVSYSKVETQVRAWLGGKLGHRRGMQEKKERPLEVV